MYYWKGLFVKDGFYRTLKSQRDTHAEIKISANFHKSWMIEQGWEIVIEKMHEDGKMIYLIDHKEANIGLSQMDESEDVC